MRCLGVLRLPGVLRRRYDLPVGCQAFLCFVGVLVALVDPGWKSYFMTYAAVNADSRETLWSM